MTSALGIISTRQVTWSAWEPGGEYTKVIKLKNVDTKTHKIKYRLPRSKCFSTKYPETITLCSGNTAKIPITFKPLDKELYTDEVEFFTKNSSFTVNVKAVLPKYSIDLPHSMEFGMCGVQSTISRTFTLINQSIETYFKWDVTAPFTIEPSLGLLPEKGQCEITIKFSPCEALVYDSTAVVSYGIGQHDLIEICGIGKHPYIMVGEGEIAEEHVHCILDFGEVPIGTSTTKTFDVKNMSPVSAMFDISQHIAGTVAMDRVFVCKNKEGSIKPNSATKVKVIFLPTIENMDYTDYFYISPAGCPSQCVVKCVGKSVAPKVELSSSLVSFNYVEVEREAQHFITLKNDSNVKTFFQIALDSKENVFSIDKSCGTLEPKAELQFLIKFLPVRPISYYKRVTVLLHRQDPLFLDLMGSGFTGDLRPALLSAKLLKQFFEKVRNGMSVYPPEVQSTMLANSDNPPSLISGVPSVDLPPCVQYFGDSQLMSESCTLHMTLDLEYLDFGKCHAFQRVHHKTVTITNHTRGRVTAIWTDKPDSVFTVLPAEVDIPPFKSTSFRVNFLPQHPNMFYGADLECVTFYKCMRETQLITDATICAPWSLSLYCSGETFEPNHEPFLPRYDTDTPALLFPPTLPDQAVFRTLLLKNTGDTPMSFHFEDDPMGLFCVKPVSGIVEEDVAIIVVRMLANQARTYQYNLKCTLNTKHMVNFPCIAAVELPTVWLENKKVMYFKPTCIGSEAEQWYGVRNTSRLPLNFEWRVAHTDNLTVSPLSGTILPNDTQYQLWKYSPKEEVRERSLNTLSIYHLKNNRRKMTVSIVGQGAHAYLECVPATIDFGILVVGESASDTVSLHNPHSCTTEYELTFEFEGDKCPVKLDKMSGSLSAYGKQELHLIYKPLSQADYTIKVRSNVNGESKVLLTVAGQGVFPKLSFIDIRSMGDLCNASKKRLWDLFSLDLLNKYLDKAPDAKELRQLMETRSNEKTKPISTKALVMMDFGSDTAGSSHSSVVIVIKNNGNVPTKFKFLFPPDLCLDMQTWAEDCAEQDQQELFDISPRDGTVLPGDTQSLVFTYRHMGCGRKELPVLLKLSRGREVLLQLRGVTVAPGSPYPQFAHLSYTLAPVVIGANNPPIQYYELYNGGDAPLSFEVIKDTLDQLAADNYGIDILQCLQTTGRVQPHSISHIPFLFSPLEVRTYAVEIPIYIIGGDTYHVTLFGEGILPAETRITQTGGVPDKQALLLDNQLAALSSEAIDFGVVPTFSVSHKIIFVTNTSPESITFRWNTNTTPISGEVLGVSPKSGTLAAGSSTMICVSLNTTSYPAFFDLDIICELTDNSKEESYLEAVAKYEHDIEEAKITFTITEPQPASPPQLDKSMDNWVAADQLLNKYHALPPIRALAPSPLDRPQKRNFNCAKSEKHDRKAKDETSEVVLGPPQAPKPFYLHLRVIGHVEDIKTFSGDLRSFDIPVASVMNPENHFSPDMQEVNKDEASTISKVLSYVLKSLLDDVDVHRAITNLSNEQIPFFAQIRRDEPAEQLAVEDSEEQAELPQVEPSQPGPSQPGPSQPDLSHPGPSQPDLSHPSDEISDYSLAPLLIEILEETLANILQESVNKEVTLTARPRIIALPPKSPLIP